MLEKDVSDVSNGAEVNIRIMNLTIFKIDVVSYIYFTLSTLIDFQCKFHILTKNTFFINIFR